MLKLSLEISAQIVVKKSRFIAFVFPCKSPEDLKKRKEDMKKLHKDARHIVFAGVFGPSAEVFSMSDDREPKGTAARPILNVLRGTKSSDIAAIVVRYFGGTLLGTGGLARAYSDSVKEALKSAVFE